MVKGYRDKDGRYLKNTRISTSTYLDHPETLSIGDNVFIGHHNFLEASGGLTIEEGCQITNFVSITTHSSHNSIRLYGTEYIQTLNHVGYVKGTVFIGKYSFIGPHVVIMPGTKIGKGSIVSAFSYVQGDFPDFSVIKGNPAVVVGDTRDIDKKFLQEHDGLQSYYDSWAKD